MALWYLFNSITIKISSINIILKHSLSEAISKKFGEKEVLFNCFDRS